MTDEAPYNETATDRLSFKDRAALAALQSRLIVGATPDEIAETAYRVAQAMERERSRLRARDAEGEA